jgi:AcrR family transcriptional regulator
VSDQGEPTTRRLGRPPRVTPAQIAEAALAIGLDQATIRNVAERLGMSVPGLYHHVRTREELLAMAAAHSLGALPLPPDRGQPWDEWLLEYARFVYDALVAQPEIIGQVLAGTYSTIRMAQHLERVFEVLGARGFTVEEAHLTLRRLNDATIGAAANEIGRRAMDEAGHPAVDDLTRAVHALGPSTVPLVEELLAGRDDADEPETFLTVQLVVDAMAARRTASGTSRATGRTSGATATTSRAAGRTGRAGTGRRRPARLSADPNDRRAPARRPDKEA